MLATYLADRHGKTGQGKTREIQAKKESGQERLKEERKMPILLSRSKFLKSSSTFPTFRRSTLNNLAPALYDLGFKFKLKFKCAQTPRSTNSILCVLLLIFNQYFFTSFPFLLLLRKRWPGWTAQRAERDGLYGLYGLVGWEQIGWDQIFVLFCSVRENAGNGDGVGRDGVGEDGRG